MYLELTRRRNLASTYAPDSKVTLKYMGQKQAGNFPFPSRI